MSPVTLGQLPSNFQAARDSLHQIAFFAIAPARYQAMGGMGLKATPGGFGTPEFDGRVARVEGDLLVHETAGNKATQGITTIRTATEFFGIDYEVDWFDDFHDPLAPADPDVTLDVDPASSRALGDWFEFGFDVLNELRSQCGPGDDVSEVQLWPEHFDAATELGDAEKGQRASFGASPGLASDPEPYIYVAPWGQIDRSHPFWNAESFSGASRSYSALLTAQDASQSALDFFLEGYRALHLDREI